MPVHGTIESAVLSIFANPAVVGQDNSTLGEEGTGVILDNIVISACTKNTTTASKPS